MSQPQHIIDLRITFKRGTSKTRTEAIQLLFAALMQMVGVDVLKVERISE